MALDTTTETSTLALGATLTRNQVNLQITGFSKATNGFNEIVFNAFVLVYQHDDWSLVLRIHSMLNGRVCKVVTPQQAIKDSTLKAVWNRVYLPNLINPEYINKSISQTFKAHKDGESSQYGTFLNLAIKGKGSQIINGGMLQELSNYFGVTHRDKEFKESFPTDPHATVQIKTEKTPAEQLDSDIKRVFNKFLNNGGTAKEAQEILSKTFNS